MAAVYGRSIVLTTQPSGFEVYTMYIYIRIDETTGKLQLQYHVRLSFVIAQINYQTTRAPPSGYEFITVYCIR